MACRCDRPGWIEGHDQGCPYDGGATPWFEQVMDSQRTQVASMQRTLDATRSILTEHLMKAVEEVIAADMENHPAPDMFTIGPDTKRRHAKMAAYAPFLAEAIRDIAEQLREK